MFTIFITDVVEGDVDLISFNFSWVQLLQFVIAIFLPLLVAVVNKRTWTGATKGITLAVLTLITTILTSILGALTTDIPVDLFTVLLTAIASFLTSVGFYTGIWSNKTKSGESIATFIQDRVGVKDDYSHPVG